MKKRISRRQFISSSVATSTALGVIANQSAQSAPTPVSMTNPGAGAWVRWLEGNAGAVAQGVTWGTPWPRGKQREAKNFVLRSADQKLQPLQSWPLAYWPDGSLKWTAHALPPGEAPNSGPLRLTMSRSTCASESSSR